MDRTSSFVVDKVAALKGEAVPALVSAISVCCLVKGIRYHDGFAQELHGNPDLPMVTRALNARAIMSNRIPTMTSPEHFPYCFWYPDMPREETLRQLLAQYPGRLLLRYQVGRACAVGGYTSLYHDLNLLPEISIAEEARDNITSGNPIYEAIMNAPIRYAYMDDYNRCLRSEPLAGAHLNGDTCVRSTLSKKQPVGPDGALPIMHQVIFDITEDRCIDLDGTIPYARPIDPQAIALLHSPLPADLPTVDKDLLILMAAWEGNIDRYVRLRRPFHLEGEVPCIIRGIHHHPLFAKWWQTQQQHPTNLFIRQAIHARCVMNNDLSWLTDSTPDSELPDLIWHPQFAHEATYRELTRRRPSMLHTVALACIYANYKSLFTSLDIIPDFELVLAAQRPTSDKFYLEHLELKAKEHGLDLDEVSIPDDEDWAGPQPHAMIRQEMDPYRPQTMLLDRNLTLDHLGFRPEELTTVSGTVGSVLLHACVADPSMRPKPPYDILDLKEMYEAGPYVGREEDRMLIGLHPPRGGYPIRGRGRGRGR